MVGSRNPDREISETERQRLEALYRYEILDTVVESEFDGLTRLASRICETPVSLINLLDMNRQWTKSSRGLDMAGTNMPRENTICRFTIQQEEILEIEDLDNDQRFNKKWYVREDPRLKFYAGAPLTTSDGYNIGAICVMDHHQRQLTEHQREDLRIVAEEVITKLELRLREKKLQQVNQQKDQLIKTVSHDLRNPLIGIIGTAEIIRESYRDEDLLNLAEIIEDSGDQMYATISELLDSGIIEFDQIQLNENPNDPVKLLQKLREVFKFLIKQKEIDFQLEVQHRPPFVLLDRHKFSRLIGNLVSNAIKFTPKRGKITIKLDYNDTGVDEGQLITRVTDTGRGIPQSYIPHLFSGDNDEIRRAGTQNETSYGMGLYIVKKLVDLHGGQVEVDTEVDVGTTFTVKVPVQSVEN